MKLRFATTNEGKLKEAKEILGIEVQGIEHDIPEIQSLDPIKVAQAKAKDYFKVVKEPLVIEDVSLAFENLNGLPGPYINDFSKALGNEGLVALALGAKAQAITTLVYIKSENDSQVFEGKIEGHIAKSPRGSNGFGWDPIFVPSGQNKTFAQMTNEEKNSFSMRKIAFEKLKEFLKTES